MNTAFILICLCLSFELMGNGDFGRFALNPGVTEVNIPFTLFDHKVVIPITINDKVTLNFLFDTGVNQPILLDKRWANKLGLKYHRKLQFHGVGTHSRIFARTTLPEISLQLPGVSGHNMTMLVLESDPLRLGRYDIHGLIGAQLLLDFVVHVNYQTKQLKLRNDLSWTPASEFQAVDIELRHLKPYVRANLAGRSLDLLLDLGAAYSLLIFENQTPGRGTKRVIEGLGGQLIGYAYKVPEFSLGNLTYYEVAALRVPAKKYSKSPVLHYRQGSLGSHLFHDQELIINYHQQKIYLKPDNSSLMNMANSGR